MTQYQRGAIMFRELDVGQSALLTDIAMCINYYRLFSPGLYCCVHATVQLDGDRGTPYRTLGRTLTFSAEKQGMRGNLILGGGWRMRRRMPTSR